MKNTIFVLLSLVLPVLSHAGCGEGSGMCYYYKSGSLVSKGECQVTTCAASTNYFFTEWKWKNKKNTVSIQLADKDKPFEERRLLLNGKPTFLLPLQLKNSRMLCYGVKDSDEIMCNDSGVF